MQFAVLALVLCAAATGLVPADEQYSLKSRRDFSVGDHPQQVISADYDGDGIADLLTADELSDAISVLKSFGDGTFRRVFAITPGTRPTGVALVDVNNDGIKDIVASNFLTQDVTVNLGNGAGGFGAKIHTAVSATAFGLATGDWNNDGKVDVVTVNTTLNNISILRGAGNGTFGNLTQIAVGTAPSQVLSGDFNSDNKADIVVVNTNSDNVQVWRGDGLGGFTLNATLATGAASGPIGAAIADLNADSHPDLVVCDQTAVNLKVFLANTSGGFNGPSTLTPGSAPRAVTAADLNKDGKLDLIVGMSSGSGIGEVAVMNGNGTGGFGSATVTSTSPYPVSVVAGDYNQDGNLDVVTASLTGETVSLLETTVGGAFIVAGKVQLASGSFPASIVVDDFNADGKKDVATADQNSSDISIVRGDGLGGFLSPSTVATGVGTGPQALVNIDPNRDGKVDLVALSFTDNTMSVLMNNGTGSFSATNGLTIGACDGPTTISAGEISGDLNPDIAFGCQISNHVCTRRGTGGSAGSAFGATVCTLLDPNPLGVALGRYDYDALQDMAVTTSSMNWVEIAISDGFGGVVDYPSTFVTGASPSGITRTDINNDGIDDLLVANSDSNTLSALLGDGGGSFTFPSIESPAGASPIAVAAVRDPDLNLDGKVDAVVVNANANNVSLMLGDGFGNFSKAGDFGTRDMPLSVGVGDFNQDGKPDLAVADNFRDTVTILLNESIIGDPLQAAQVMGQLLTIYRWGLVPGAFYDVIRGNVTSVTQQASTFNLGPVTCLANDISVTDTVATPDNSLPPVGQAWFYMVRPVLAGVPGQYSVATNGKPGVPASGGCQ